MTTLYKFQEFKFAPDGATKGIISGYGSTFGNLDGSGDVIAKGAFKQSLRAWEDRGKYPPMLLQHGGGMFGGNADDKVPIGKWDLMEENSKGLKVEGHLIALDTDTGKRVLAALQEGVLDGLSIGAYVRKWINGTKPGEPSRTFTELDLFELSVVTFPANPKARVSAVKSLTRDEVRELEASLRDAGLSRRDCERAIPAFRQWLLRGDAGVPTNLAEAQRDPAQTATLADVLRTARKVRAGISASR